MSKANINAKKGSTSALIPSQNIGNNKKRFYRVGTTVIRWENEIAYLSTTPQQIHVVTNLKDIAKLASKMADTSNISKVSTCFLPF